LDIAKQVQEQARQAQEASRVLARTEVGPRNLAILRMAQLIRENISEVAEANQEDLKEAQENGINQHLLNRLVFDRPKIEARADALETIAALPDPLGEADYLKRRPSGLEVKRVRTPLGVVAIVFEARPHVVANVGAVCLKAGNAAIMRGGSEALRSITALGKLWRQALQERGLPEKALQVIATTDRDAVNTLITQEEHIDVLIPRGGKGLIQLIKEKASIPIIKHFEGICHVYLDQAAREEMAVQVTHNSKMFMPEVCNAAETLLVHEQAARRLLPPVAAALMQEGVTLKGCPKAREIIAGMEEALEEDWRTEYLDLILSVKVVSSLEEAIAHINHYGSQHTDVIVSSDYEAIKQFTREVDSGVVLANASTMFNDGEELGMGAEVGISTDKLQARGPVGIKELTSYKYIVEGQGHIM